MKRALFGALAVVCVMAGLALSAEPGTAADHLEAPLVQMDGRTDINDLYAFESPDNPDNTVLIMTVNPGAGVLSPTTFDNEGAYRFRIDNTGNARVNKTIRVRFGPVRDDGSQRYWINGAAGSTNGVTGETTDLAGGGRAFAGTFDDPFFFDFQAFQDQVKAAGGPRTFCDDGATDFFRGLNVSAIVVEVPTAKLTGATSNIGVWAETRNAAGGADRMGRPAIATALINDGNEDFFNRRPPHRQQGVLGNQVSHNLMALSGLDGSGYTKEEAMAISQILLPDVLTYDTSAPANYLNGRSLADDVMDTSLAVVTGALGANASPVLDSDCVDTNDVDFPSGFPFLADPAV